MTAPSSGAYESMIGVGLGLVTVGIVTLVDYLRALRGANRHALHDIAAKTVVARPLRSSTAQRPVTCPLESRIGGFHHG